jgi:hypothetical protein
MPEAAGRRGKRTARERCGTWRRNAARCLYTAATERCRPRKSPLPTGRDRTPNGTEAQQAACSYVAIKRGANPATRCESIGPRRWGAEGTAEVSLSTHLKSGLGWSGLAPACSSCCASPSSPASSARCSGEDLSKSSRLTLQRPEGPGGEGEGGEGERGRGFEERDTVRGNKKGAQNEKKAVIEGRKLGGGRERREG